jgi:putative oxidoreductase
MMNKQSDWTRLILRSVTGAGFIVHGWAKISRGTAGFEKLMVFLGVPAPHLMSLVVPYVELLGGIAVLIGLMTRIVSVALMGVMLVALFTIHIHFGFSSIKTTGLTANGPVFGPPGYEINLLYIAILLSLIITGAGRLSIDYLLMSKKTRKVE